jgi:hypothetical protein
VRISQIILKLSSIYIGSLRRSGNPLSPSLWPPSTRSSFPLPVLPWSVRERIRCWRNSQQHRSRHLFKEDLIFLALARPPPRWLGEGRSRRATRAVAELPGAWSPTASTLGCRTRDDEKLRPLASMANREKVYITTSPPHRDLAANGFFAELAALLPLLGSDHRSWTRSSRSPTWRRIQPRRSAAPLLTMGIAPCHGSRLGSLLLKLPILRLVPRLSLFQAASPPVRASVRPGEGGVTLRWGAMRRGRERRGKKVD